MEGLQILLPLRHKPKPLRVVNKSSEPAPNGAQSLLSLYKENPRWQILVIFFFNIIRALKVTWNETKPNQTSYLSRTAEEDNKKHRQCYSQNIDHPEPWALLSCLEHLANNTWLKNKTEPISSSEGFWHQCRLHCPAVQWLRSTTQALLFPKGTSQGVHMTTTKKKPYRQ